MKELNYSTVYFMGIGGIGMSALARFFHHHHIKTLGYDKTKSPLTEQLESEGIAVHYEDWGEKIQHYINDISSTLIVVTPAVPHQLEEWQYLEKMGYTILKRAAVLGHISKYWKTLAVAGTHGKTTTSAMLAHVLSDTKEKCNAFLGGIDRATQTNLLIEPESPWMVVEADEYDKSFLQLKPFAAIITSIDPDHLDIYKNKAEFVKTFYQFGALVPADGKLILHHSLEVTSKAEIITYGITKDQDIDYRAENITTNDGHFIFDIITPTKKYNHIQLTVPGTHNIENALAVFALTETLGYDFEKIRASLQLFQGVKRRFETLVKKNNLIYIDDYAHHPTAINRLINSVKMLYKNQPIYLIFQPHLYSRTRDFMQDFANELSQVDEVVLMPIYPAREEPIPGITSVELAKLITTKVQVLEHNTVLEYIKTIKSGIILTVGAGNIDRLVSPIYQLLK